MTGLLTGATGSGKSSQLALLAQSLYQKTGLPLRIYHGDPGGYESLRPFITKGVIDLIDLFTVSPWKPYEQAVKGLVWDPDTNGWGEGSAVSGWAFEGLSSWCSLMAIDIHNQAASGKNIGGSASLNVKMADGAILTQLSQANFGQIQSRIKKLCWESLNLQRGAGEGKVVIWTALDAEGEDEAGGQRVLGSKLIGKALTNEVAQWFNYTFHLERLPQAGKEVHRLYTKLATAETNMSVWATANERMPIWLDANGEVCSITTPDYIEPANIVKALQMVEDAHLAAASAIG